MKNYTTLSSLIIDQIELKKYIDSSVTYVLLSCCHIVVYVRRFTRSNIVCVSKGSLTTENDNLNVPIKTLFSE